MKIHIEDPEKTKRLVIKTLRDLLNKLEHPEPKGMSPEEFHKLPSGLYCITWTDDTQSLAAIGLTPKGDRWLVCTDWCDWDSGGVRHDTLSRIKRADIISHTI